MFEKIFQNRGKSKKTIALIIVFCFVFSIVGGQPLHAAIELYKGVTVSKKIVNEFFIPPDAGRVSSYKLYNGPKLVINIQDLHCNPEVQKNISKILSSLDSRFKLSNIYVEGSHGSIDTSWLSAGNDKDVNNKIVNKLLENGVLTGGEYFSITSGKNSILVGIDDEKLHKENLLRLSAITSEKNKVDSFLNKVKSNLEILKDRYYSAKNRKLETIINEYRQGNLKQEKYYPILSKYADEQNIDLKTYPNLYNIANSYKTAKKLDYRKIESELKLFVGTIKKELPYKIFNQLAEQTDNFSKVNELYASLSKIAINYPALSINYQNLNEFFAYMRSSMEVNPIELIKEEQKLLRELSLRFALEDSERDVLFLADFANSLNNYLLNKASVEDYEYVKRDSEKYNLLWARYIGVDNLSEIEQYTTLLNKYYETNLKRNESFIKNIPELTAQSKGLHSNSEISALNTTISDLADKSEIVVLVTGGFHTDGVKKLLSDNGISYMVITPNVSRDDAQFTESVYSNLLKEQTEMLSKAFALEQLALYMGTNKEPEYAYKAMEEILKASAASGFSPGETVKVFNNYLEKRFMEKSIKTKILVLNDNTASFVLTSEKRQSEYVYNQKGSAYELKIDGVAVNIENPERTRKDKLLKSYSKKVAIGIGIITCVEIAFQIVESVGFPGITQFSPLGQYKSFFDSDFVKFLGVPIGSILAPAVLAAFIAAITNRFAVLRTDNPSYEYRPLLRGFYVVALSFFLGALTGFFFKGVLDKYVSSSALRNLFSITFQFLSNAVQHVWFGSIYNIKGIDNLYDKGKGIISKEEWEKERELFSLKKQWIKYILLTVGYGPFMFLHHELTQNYFKGSSNQSIYFFGSRLVLEVFANIMANKKATTEFPLRFFVILNVVLPAAAFVFMTGLNPGVFYLSMGTSALILSGVYGSKLIKYLKEKNGLKEKHADKDVEVEKMVEKAFGFNGQEIRQIIDAAVKSIADRWRESLNQESKLQEFSGKLCRKLLGNLPKTTDKMLPVVTEEQVSKNNEIVSVLSGLEEKKLKVKTINVVTYDCSMMPFKYLDNGEEKTGYRHINMKYDSKNNLIVELSKGFWMLSPENRKIAIGCDVDELMASLGKNDVFAYYVKMNTAAVEKSFFENYYQYIRELSLNLEIRNQLASRFGDNIIAEESKKANFMLEVLKKAEGVTFKLFMETLLPVGEIPSVIKKHVETFLNNNNAKEIPLSFLAEEEKKTSIDNTSVTDERMPGVDTALPGLFIWEAYKDIETIIATFYKANGSEIKNITAIFMSILTNKEMVPLFANKVTEALIDKYSNEVENGNKANMEYIEREIMAGLAKTDFLYPEFSEKIVPLLNSKYLKYKDFKTFYLLVRLALKLKGNGIEINRSVIETVTREFEEAIKENNKILFKRLSPALALFVYKPKGIDSEFVTKVRVYFEEGNIEYGLAKGDMVLSKKYKDAISQSADEKSNINILEYTIAFLAQEIKVTHEKEDNETIERISWALSKIISSPDIVSLNPKLAKYVINILSEKLALSHENNIKLLVEIMIMIMGKSNLDEGYLREKLNSIKNKYDACDANETSSPEFLPNMTDGLIYGAALDNTSDNTTVINKNITRRVLGIIEDKTNILAEVIGKDPNMVPGGNNQMNLYEQISLGIIKGIEKTKGLNSFLGNSLLQIVEKQIPKATGWNRYCLFWILDTIQSYKKDQLDSIVLDNIRNKFSSQFRSDKDSNHEIIDLLDSVQIVEGITKFKNPDQSKQILKTRTFTVFSETMGMLGSKTAADDPEVMGSLCFILQELLKTVHGKTLYFICWGIIAYSKYAPKTFPVNNIVTIVDNKLQSADNVGDVEYVITGLISGMAQHKVSDSLSISVLSMISKRFKKMGFEKVSGQLNSDAIISWLSYLTERENPEYLSKLFFNVLGRSPVSSEVKYLPFVFERSYSRFKGGWEKEYKKTIELYGQIISEIIETNQYVPLKDQYIIAQIPGLLLKHEIMLDEVLTDNKTYADYFSRDILIGIAGKLSLDEYMSILKNKILVKYLFMKNEKGSYMSPGLYITYEWYAIKRIVRKYFSSISKFGRLTDEIKPSPEDIESNNNIALAHLNWGKIMSIESVIKQFNEPNNERLSDTAKKLVLIVSENGKPISSVDAGSIRKAIYERLRNEIELKRSGKTNNLDSLIKGIEEGYSDSDRPDTELSNTLLPLLPECYEFSGNPWVIKTILRALSKTKGLNRIIVERVLFKLTNLVGNISEERAFEVAPALAAFVEQYKIVDENTYLMRMINDKLDENMLKYVDKDILGSKILNDEENISDFVSNSLSTGNGITDAVAEKLLQQIVDQGTNDQEQSRLISNNVIGNDDLVVSLTEGVLKASISYKTAVNVFEKTAKAKIDPRILEYVLPVMVEYLLVKNKESDNAKAIYKTMKNLDVAIVEQIADVFSKQGINVSQLYNIEKMDRAALRLMLLILFRNGIDNVFAQQIIGLLKLDESLNFDNGHDNRISNTLETGISNMKKSKLDENIVSVYANRLKKDSNSFRRIYGLIMENFKNGKISDSDYAYKLIGMLFINNSSKLQIFGKNEKSIMKPDFIETIILSLICRMTKLGNNEDRVGAAWSLSKIVSNPGLKTINRNLSVLIVRSLSEVLKENQPTVPNESKFIVEAIIMVLAKGQELDDKFIFDTLELIKKIYMQSSGEILNKMSNAFIYGIAKSGDEDKIRSFLMDCINEKIIENKDDQHVAYQIAAGISTAIDKAVTISNSLAAEIKILIKRNISKTHPKDNYGWLETIKSSERAATELETGFYDDVARTLRSEIVRSISNKSVRGKNLYSEVASVMDDTKMLDSRDIGKLAETRIAQLEFANTDDLPLAGWMLVDTVCGKDKNMPEETVRKVLMTLDAKLFKSDLHDKEILIRNIVRALSDTKEIDPDVFEQFIMTMGKYINPEGISEYDSVMLKEWFHLMMEKVNYSFIKEYAEEAFKKQGVLRPICDDDIKYLAYTLNDLYEEHGNVGWQAKYREFLSYYASLIKLIEDANNRTIPNYRFDTARTPVVLLEKQVKTVKLIEFMNNKHITIEKYLSVNRFLKTEEFIALALDGTMENILSGVNGIDYKKLFDSLIRKKLWKDEAFYKRFEKATDVFGDILDINERYKIIFNYVGISRNVDEVFVDKTNQNNPVFINSIGYIYETLKTESKKRAFARIVSEVSSDYSIDCDGKSGHEQFWQLCDLLKSFGPDWEGIIRNYDLGHYKNIRDLTCNQVFAGLRQFKGIGKYAYFIHNAEIINAIKSQPSADVMVEKIQMTDLNEQVKVDYSLLDRKSISERLDMMDVIGQLNRMYDAKIGFEEAVKRANEKESQWNEILKQFIELMDKDPNHTSKRARGMYVSKNNSELTSADDVLLDIIYSEQGKDIIKQAIGIGDEDDLVNEIKTLSKQDIHARVRAAKYPILLDLIMPYYRIDEIDMQNAKIELKNDDKISNHIREILYQTKDTLDIMDELQLYFAINSKDVLDNPKLYKYYGEAELMAEASQEIIASLDRIKECLTSGNSPELFDIRAVNRYILSKRYKMTLEKSYKYENESLVKRAKYYSAGRGVYLQLALEKYAGSSEKVLEKVLENKLGREAFKNVMVAKNVRNNYLFKTLNELLVNPEITDYKAVHSFITNPEKFFKTGYLSQNKYLKEKKIEFPDINLFKSTDFVNLTPKQFIDFMGETYGESGIQLFKPFKVEVMIDGKKYIAEILPKSDIRSFVNSTRFHKFGSPIFVEKLMNQNSSPILISEVVKEGDKYYVNELASGDVKGCKKIDIEGDIYDNFAMPINNMAPEQFTNMDFRNVFMPGLNDLISPEVTPGIEIPISDNLSKDKETRKNIPEVLKVLFAEYVKKYPYADEKRKYASEIVVNADLMAGNYEKLIEDNRYVPQNILDGSINLKKKVGVIKLGFENEYETIANPLGTVYPESINDIIYFAMARNNPDVLDVANFIKPLMIMMNEYTAIRMIEKINGSDRDVFSCGIFDADKEKKWVSRIGGTLIGYAGHRFRDGKDETCAYLRSWGNDPNVGKSGLNIVFYFVPKMIQLSEKIRLETGQRLYVELLGRENTTLRMVTVTPRQVEALKGDKLTLARIRKETDIGSYAGMGARRVDQEIAFDPDVPKVYELHLYLEALGMDEYGIAFPKGLAQKAAMKTNHFNENPFEALKTHKFAEENRVSGIRKLEPLPALLSQLGTDRENCKGNTFKTKFDDYNCEIIFDRDGCIRDINKIDAELVKAVPQMIVRAFEGLFKSYPKFTAFKLAPYIENAVLVLFGVVLEGLGFSHIVKYGLIVLPILYYAFALHKEVIVIPDEKNIKNGYTSYNGKIYKINTADDGTKYIKPSTSLSDKSWIFIKSWLIIAGSLGLADFLMIQGLPKLMAWFVGYIPGGLIHSKLNKISWFKGKPLMTVNGTDTRSQLILESIAGQIKGVIGNSFNPKNITKKIMEDPAIINAEKIGCINLAYVNWYSVMGYGTDIVSMKNEMIYDAENTGANRIGISLVSQTDAAKIKDGVVINKNIASSVPGVQGPVIRSDGKDMRLDLVVEKISTKNKKAALIINVVLPDSIFEKLSKTPEAYNRFTGIVAKRIMGKIAGDSYFNKALTGFGLPISGKYMPKGMSWFNKNRLKPQIVSLFGDFTSDAFVQEGLEVVNTEIDLEAPYSSQEEQINEKVLFKNCLNVSIAQGQVKAGGDSQSIGLVKNYGEYAKMDSVQKLQMYGDEYRTKQVESVSRKETDLILKVAEKDFNLKYVTDKFQEMPIPSEIAIWEQFSGKSNLQQNNQINSEIRNIKRAYNLMKREINISLGYEVVDKENINNLTDLIKSVYSSGLDDTPVNNIYINLKPLETQNLSEKDIERFYNWVISLKGIINNISITKPDMSIVFTLPDSLKNMENEIASINNCYVSGYIGLDKLGNTSGSLINKYQYVEVLSPASEMTEKGATEALCGIKNMKALKGLILDSRLMETDGMKNIASASIAKVLADVLKCSDNTPEGMEKTGYREGFSFFSTKELIKLNEEVFVSAQVISEENIVKYFADYESYNQKDVLRFRERFLNRMARLNMLSETQKDLLRIKLLDAHKSGFVKGLVDAFNKYRMEENIRKQMLNASIQSGLVSAIEAAG